MAPGITRENAIGFRTVQLMRVCVYVLQNNLDTNDDVEQNSERRQI